jgi:hypothetical protein
VLLDADQFTRYGEAHAGLPEGLLEL